MSKAQVVVIYGEKLESITVDGVKMEDIDYIRQRSVQDWFSPSGGREGWEGLIREVKKMLVDEQADLSFEFHGSEEIQTIFEDIVQKAGYGSNKQEQRAMIEKHVEDAKTNESRGLYKKAFSEYLHAARYGNHREAQYKVAEYYMNCVRGDTSVIEDEHEIAVANAVKFYEAAAKQGYLEAREQLYKMFWEGKEVVEDKKYALQWLKQLAEHGEAHYQYEYGKKLTEIYENKKKKHFNGI